MDKSARVLIVDDKINVRTTIKNSLLGFVCNFFEAGCEETALDLIENNIFDVIFLDLKIPGSSGLEIYKKAKQIQPNLGKVIVLTGYPEPETAAEAEELGVFAYLSKASIDRDIIRKTFTKATACDTQAMPTQ